MSDLKYVQRRQFLRSAIVATTFAGCCTDPFSDSTLKADGPPQGLALCLGLNELDPSHYPGAARLFGCVNDANEMKKRAEKGGFTSKILTDRQATYENVREHVLWVPKKLKAGQTFLLSMSSHGTQIRDDSSDEEDGSDEAWCLYDQMLLDDTVFGWLGKIASAGINVVVVLDSCHSGTAIRDMIITRNQSRGLATEDKLPHVSSAKQREFKNHIARSATFSGAQAAAAPFSNTAALSRALPNGMGTEVFRANLRTYAPQQRLKQSESSVMRDNLPILLLSACQDAQSASDGDQNGLFTWSLLEALNGDPANYIKLYEKTRHIVETHTSRQVPNYFPLSSTTQPFENKPPFTI